MRARYQELIHDLKILQKWLKQQEQPVHISSLWDWLCERSRERTVRLLFWPEFLECVKADPYCITVASSKIKLSRGVDPSHIDATYAPPQVIAQEFLAASYGVSEETIRLVVKRGDPKHQAIIRQTQSLLEDLLTIFAGAKAMASKDLVKALKKLDHSRWEDLTQKILANLLRPLRVEVGTVRLSGKKTLKGYYRKDLERALRSTVLP